MAIIKKQLTIIPPSGSVGVTVRLEDGTAKQVSEQLAFTVSNVCVKKPVHLMWMNDLGGFDSHTFTLYNQSQLQADADLYVNNRTQKKLLRETLQEIQLSTEMLSEEQIKYVTGLVTSSRVFWYKDSVLHPIIVNIGSIPDEGMGVINISISLMSARKRKLQHG